MTNDEITASEAWKRGVAAAQATLTDTAERIRTELAEMDVAGDTDGNDNHGRRHFLEWSLERFERLDDGV